MNRAAKRHQKKSPRKTAKNRRGRPPQALGPGSNGAPANRFAVLVQNAIRLHQTGQVREAETIYRRVLDIDPDHADANHLRGLLLAQGGHRAQAVDFMSRAIATAPDRADYHSNLGAVLHKLGRLEEAVASHRKALAIEPGWAEAHYNLGTVLQELDRLDDASISYRRALTIKPDYAQAHYNLGNVFQELGRQDDALAGYRQALAVEPDYPDAHFNMANVLGRLGRFEEAVASYRKGLAIKPDRAEAHINMGNILTRLGRIEEAVASYHKALAIKLDFAEAWNNLKFATKALHFSEAQPDRRENLDQSGLGLAARATGEFAMFEYFLEKYRPHEADESFTKAMAALPPKTDQEVTVNGTDHGPAPAPRLPDKMVALLHFGRSGTGFFHGLIDGHPEISTLPSIYLRGFFNAGVWDNLAADGWRGLPERFADAFEVLFDATSPKPTPGKLNDVVRHMGVLEGMTAVGEGGDEALSLDRDKFCAEATRLMKHFEKIDPAVFLKIIHGAYEKTLGTKTEKHTIFYHIHNPDDFAMLNFLRYAPDARLVMMVREPIQSCESWLQKPFKENDYDRISARILDMLFAIDQIPFRTQKSVGVRLEDLKKHPQATLRGLCAWLGVEEAPSLYETTAQGKKWWGDPSSPDYDQTKSVSAFDATPIRRAVGTVFSDRDQFILRTLFYPFSVRFGYRDADPIEFKKNLREIRPELDDLLDIEKVLSENSGIDPAHYKRSGTYLLLHAGMLDRWNVLDELGDYPGMLTPLDIE